MTEDDYPNVNQTIQKFDLSKRKVDKLIEDVNDFTVSFDGEKDSLPQRRFMGHRVGR